MSVVVIFTHLFLHVFIAERVRNISSKCFQSGFRMMSEYIYFFLISYSGTLYVNKLLFVFMYLWGGGDENAQVNLDFQNHRLFLGGGGSEKRGEIKRDKSSPDPLL